MSDERSVGSDEREGAPNSMAFLTKAIRLDPELYAATKAEAERLGVSWSEYVRQSLATRMAWSLALRVVQEGGTPESMLGASGPDMEATLRVAREIAARMETPE